MRKLLPYRLYVPDSCRDGRSAPLVVGLHGGGGPVDEMFDMAGGRICAAAEKYGFIFMTPSGGVWNSSYGCDTPPVGMKGGDYGFNSADPQKVWEKAASERSLTQALNHIEALYNIAKDRAFLMGNSMGGMGTFYYASRHPERFRAISPAGAAPDPERFDASGLMGMPIFFVAGTEDHHGYHYLEQAYRAFKSRGLDIGLRTVPGGSHGCAWADVFDETMEFFFG